MTVALGLVCSDGVIVASDSMASSGAIATKETKVFAFDELPLVWTASGTIYAIEEVQHSLKELEGQARQQAAIRQTFTEPKLDLVRQNLQTCAHKALKDCYDTALPAGGQTMLRDGKPYHPFFTDFLFLGYSNGIPYLLEFAADGQLNWHTAERFYAIGSSGDFAKVCRAMMGHYIEGDELTVELGLRIAYRTIQTTIEVSSQYVGPPVQLAQVSENGAHVLDEGEREAVRDAVEGWLLFERDSLKTPQAAATEVPPKLKAE